MAELEILVCGGCRAPLKPGSLVCSRCKTQNVIKSKRNPLKIDSNIAKEYIDFYSEKTKENPKDTNALYAMGLLYLNMKNYELAQRNFKEAIDLSPLDADVYYYYALSLIGGRNLKTLDGKDIDRIEEYLKTAISMETKCKYLMLLIAIKNDYYTANGLRVRGDSANDLFNMAKDYLPEDLDEILEHAAIREKRTLNCFDIVLGRANEADTNGEDDEDSDPDEEEDEAYVNLTAEQRKQFFDYRFKPIKPGTDYNKLPPEYVYLKKPGYPIVNRVWKLILTVLLTIVLYVILTVAKLGIGEMETTVEKKTVAEMLNEYESIRSKPFTKKEREVEYTKTYNDSIEQAREDSAYYANHFVFAKVEGKGEDKNQLFVQGFKKEWMSLIWAFLLFLPLITWLWTTISRLSGIAKERSDVAAHNKMLNDNYAYEIEMYNTKPTNRQMENFIFQYMSTIVDAEFEYHGIHEEDLEGKTLFISDYFKYTEDGENYADSGVEYVVAILEDTHVSVFRSDWRIYEDLTEVGEAETAFYSDIKSVRLTEDTLSFGDISINLPSESVFEYQNHNPNDTISYSTDRTSDPREFKHALDKLVNSFKNK